MHGRGRGRGHRHRRGRTQKLKGVSHKKSFSKVNCLKLSLDILQVFHNDRDRQRTYFEGPYVVEANGNIVGEGQLLCYRKSDIADEMQRQFDFYCHAYLSD